MGEYVIGKIAAQVRLMQVLRHERIFSQGDACGGFYVVSYGHVRLSLFSKKKVERPIHLVEPGQSFGEAAVFQDQCHYMTAIATQDSGLLFVPREMMEYLLQADWRLGERMLASMAQSMRRMVNDIDDFLLQPPGKRLASYLIRIAQPKASANSSVTFALKKTLVAAQLNFTPETLSRQLRAFSRSDLISVDGGKITILDIDRLREYVRQE